jgi:dTDP-4-dehydrorhamnose reductase
MKKVLVLGGNGMLGAALVRWFADNAQVLTTATSRTGESPLGLPGTSNGVNWVALDVDQTSVGELLDLCGRFDLVVNAIGRIKQRINLKSLADREATLRANSVFALMLAQAAEAGGFKVVQIATDCVFSGNVGGYTETDKHDADDLYGMSKSLGEIESSKVFNLRCSIIGLELSSSFSLLNWFLAQPKGAQINGYTNHFWNGITALHFAKICGGLLAAETSCAFNTHLVPANCLTKHDLLNVFSEAFDRRDVTIIPIEAPQRIDRTLTTGNEELNQKLWLNAGYSTPPSIEEMVAEIASHAKR